MLITRTPDRAEELVHRLREFGARPVLAPVREAVPVVGTEAAALAKLTTAIAGAAAPDWLAVTSANTVRALHAVAARRSRGLGDLLAPSIARGLQIAAVGEATAGQLRAHGLPVHLVPPATRASAKGMVERWPAPPSSSDPGQRPGALAGRAPTVYLPQSVAARTTLSEGLGAKGWHVRTVVAYRSASWPAASPLHQSLVPEDLTVWTVEQARDHLRNGAVDVVVASAPSLLQALVGTDPHSDRDQAFSVWPDTVGVVAMGPPTRSAARALGITAHTAVEPTPEGLVDAVRRAVSGTEPSDRDVQE